MYKLLIVDDEEIEREGMARFIPWEEYGIELVGTAWNGVEGFEKIQSEEPDIVLTDIKMPVMDGIELIRKTREIFPLIEFVVLSGYGEFEFTSQAMEQGVRHYLLKPCDEDQIRDIMDKAKREVDQKKRQFHQEKDYQETMGRLLPRARKQIFRDMLLGREQTDKEYGLFLEEYGTCQEEILLLGFRIEKGFDYLEQFILENMLTELLGEENVYLGAAVHTEFVFLLNSRAKDRIGNAVERTAQEFKRIRQGQLCQAVSEPGEIRKAASLYNQITEMLEIGSAEKRKGLLDYRVFKDASENASSIVDYAKIRSAKDYSEILFELYLSFMKMELSGFTFQQKEELMNWVMKVLYGEVLKPSVPKGTEEEMTWALIEILADTAAGYKNLDKDNILLAVFAHLRDQKLNIQYLAKEILFMNEDYFGRIFQKSQKMKFSAFLLEKRILLAMRLLQYDPELKIAQLAEMVGYSPDGQYFSKAFKKVAGMPPTEYRGK